MVSQPAWPTHRIRATQPGRKLAFFISPGWALVSRAGIEATDKQRKTTFSSIVEFTNGLRAAHLSCIPRSLLSRTKQPLLLSDLPQGHPERQQSRVRRPRPPGPRGSLRSTVQTTGMDIKGEINNAVRDANAYYTLTFDAPPADHTDEYHDLHVQVNKTRHDRPVHHGYYSNVQH